MTKLIVQGTPGGEYLLIRKGKVAHGVKNRWQDVLTLALQEGYDALLLDGRAMLNIATEITTTTVRP